MVKAADVVKAAPKFLGTPYSKLDCQAFVESCLKSAGNGMNLAGSNAWYRECMKNGWVGTPEECLNKYGKIPVGAFLFILSHNGKEPGKYKSDGIGNASHIGLYTGETGKEMVEQARSYGVASPEHFDFGNGAIHSSSSRGFVCTSNFTGKAIKGGWNRIGLWNGIDYGIEGNEMSVSYQARVVGGALNVRKTASTGAEKLCRIPDGTIVHVTEEDGEWAKTSYSGHTGWVLKKYLEETGADSDTVVVPRKELEAVYDLIGNFLGLRG